MNTEHFGAPTENLFPDPPPNVSDKEALNLGSQFAYVNNDIPNIPAYSAQIKLGHEDEMRMALSLQRSHVYQKIYKDWLDQSLSDGNLPDARKAIQYISAGVPHDPIILENSVASKASEESQWDEKNAIVKIDSPADTIYNAKLLALNNALPEIFKGMAEHYKADIKTGAYLPFNISTHMVADLAAFFIPGRVTLANVKSFDSPSMIGMPGTERRLEAKALFDLPADQFRTELSSVIARNRNASPDNLLLGFTNTLAAIVTEAGGDPEMLKYFQADTYVDEQGVTQKNQANLLFDPTSYADQTFTSERFENIADHPIWDILGVYGGIKGAFAAVKLGARVYGAAAVSKAMVKALETGTITPEVFDAGARTLRPTEMGAATAGTPEVFDAWARKMERLMGNVFHSRTSDPATAGQLEEVVSVLQKTHNGRINHVVPAHDGDISYLSVFIGAEHGGPFSSLEAAEAKRLEMLGEVVGDKTELEHLYRVVPNADDPESFFIQTDRATDADGFIQPIDLAIYDRWWQKILGGNTQIGRRGIWSPTLSDTRTKAAGTAIHQVMSQIRDIQSHVNSSMSKLSRESRGLLRSVIDEGKKELDSEGHNGVWFDRETFETRWRTLHGKAATNEEWAGYQAFKLAHEYNHFLEESPMIKDLHFRGYNHFDVKVGDEILRVIGTDEKSPSSGSKVFLNAEATDSPERLRITNDPPLDQDGKVLVSDAVKLGREEKPPLSGDVISGSEARKVLGEDEKIIKLEGEGLERNGELITHIIVKKSESPAILLRPGAVLEKRAGGTRGYGWTWFTKQRNGNSHITLGIHASRKAAQAYANKLGRIQSLFNQYKVAVNQILGPSVKGSSSLRKVPESFDSMRAGFNRELQKIDSRYTMGELERMEQSGEFNPNEAIHALYDREPLPAKGFEQHSDRGIPLFQRGNGRLYYSRQGHFLKDANGELAPLQHPFKLLADQQQHAATVAGYAAFKIREIRRWVKAYDPHILTPGIEHPTDLEKLKYGVLNKTYEGMERGAFNKVRNAAMAQQDYLKRTLHTPTALDDHIRNQKEWMARSLSIIAGDSKYAEFLPDMFKTGKVFTKGEVISWLKGWAFDRHLGGLSFGQIVQQGSAAATAITMHPVYGLQAAKDISFLQAAVRSGMNPHVLDILDEGIVAKGLGYKPGEFKELADIYNKTGLDIVSTSDAYMEGTVVGNVTGSSVLSKVINKGREIGRIPFHIGERIGRTTTFGIAKRLADEAVAKGTFAYKSPEYIDFIREQSNAMQLNMMAGINHWWHDNPVTSLGMQFLRYQWNAHEIFLGMNKSLTPQQKAGFMIGSTLMYGAYGVPFGPTITKMAIKEYQDATGKPLNEEVQKILLYGAVDAVIRNVFGADSAIATVIGPGDFIPGLFRRLTGVQGESALGVAFGTTGDDLYKFAKAFPALLTLYHAWAEAAWTGKGPPMAEFVGDETLHGMGQMLRGMNTISRGFHLWKTRELLNSKYGLVEGQSKYNAVLVGLGIPSHIEIAPYSIYEDKKKRKELVIGTATQLARMRTIYVNATDGGDATTYKAMLSYRSALLSDIDDIALENEITSMEGFILTHPQGDIIYPLGSQ